MWLSVEFGRNEIEIQDTKGRTVTKESVQVRPYDVESIEILTQKKKITQSLTYAVCL